jgi:hypothetical protein
MVEDFKVVTALVLLKFHVFWKVMLCHCISRAFHLHVSLGLLDPLDEVCLILQNARSYLPINTTSYPT